MSLISREDHHSTQLVISQDAIQRIIFEKVATEYPDLRNTRKPVLRFIDEEGKEIKPSFMCELYYDEGIIPKRNGES